MRLNAKPGGLGAVSGRGRGEVAMGKGWGGWVGRQGGDAGGMGLSVRSDGYTSQNSG